MANSIAFRMLALLTLALTTGPAALAHFVWIETDKNGGQIAVRAGFGEVDAWEAEYAPKIASAEYWIVRPDAKPDSLKLTWDKAAESYAGEIDEKANAAAIGGKCTWGLFGRGGTTESLVVYYPKAMVGDPANWGKAKPVESAKVEIVPVVERSTIKLTILVDGNPAKGEKIKFYAPDSDKVESDSDEAGSASFSIVKPGLYSVTVVHRTTASGEHDGKPYEGVMHCATLTFRVDPKRFSAN